MPLVDVKGLSKKYQILVGAGLETESGKVVLTHHRTY